MEAGLLLLPPSKGPSGEAPHQHSLGQIRLGAHFHITSFSLHPSELKFFTVTCDRFTPSAQVEEKRCIHHKMSNQAYCPSVRTQARVS